VLAIGLARSGDLMGWLSDITDDFLGLDDTGGILGSVETALTNPLKSFRTAKEKIIDDVAGIDDSGGTLGSIVALGENIEDSLREGIEDVDAALQNKYVRSIIKLVSTVSPDPFTRGVATYLDAYATVDSGEDLSAGQVLGLATSTAGMYNASQEAATTGGAGFDDIDAGTMPVNVEPTTFSDAARLASNQTIGQILSVGAEVADGAEFSDAVFNVFQKDLVAGLTGGVANDFELDPDDVEALTNTLIDYTETGELSTAVANNLGDFTAKHVFNLPIDTEGPYTQDTTNKLAAVKAGLQGLESLDQGENFGEAVFNAANTYFTEEGELDLVALSRDKISGFGVDLENIFSGLTGIDLPDLPELPDYNFPTVELAGKYLLDNGWGFDDITKLPGFEGIDLNLDLGVELGNLQFNPGDFDGDFGNFDIVLPDRIDMDLPDLSIGTEITLPDAPEITKIELPSFSIPEIPEVDIEIPEIDLEAPEVPEAPEVDIETPEVDIDLDLNLPSRQLARFAGLLKDDEEEEKRALQEYKFAQGLRDLGTIDIPT